MKSIYEWLRLPLLIVFCMLSTLPARADFVLNASCSSQIAEAFGREELEQYMADHGVKVRIMVFPSNVCIERLKNGFCNLAGSTTGLSKADKNAGLIEIPICKDAMAVTAHPGSSVKNLSLQQVRDIFSGTIRNWKEVGGGDMPITLIIPAKTTGAYKNFVNHVMNSIEVRDDLVAANTFTALTGIKYVPGSISFITHSIAIRYNDVDIIHVDGVDPADKNYPFTQIFYLMIKGQPDPMLKEVINYLISDQAQQRMKARGIIPIIK